MCSLEQSPRENQPVCQDPGPAASRMLGNKPLLISHPQLMAFCYSSLTNIVSSAFKESYEREKGRIWLVEYLTH